jgi:hypothetical protein
MRAPLLLAGLLAACGGGSSSSTAPTPPSPPAAPQLTLASEAQSATAGGKAIRLDATATPGSAISWTLSAGAPGSLSAGTGASINYQPPAFLTAPVQVTLTASTGGSTKSLTLQLQPAAPASSISFVAGGTGSAAVIDGTADQAQFSRITSMAAAKDGGMIVIDSGALRSVSSTGEVRTLNRATLSNGDDAVTGAFQQVLSTAVDPAGQIYVTASRTWSPRTALSQLNEAGQLVDVAALPDGQAIVPPGQAADSPAGLLAVGGGRFYVRYANYIVLVENGASRILAGAPQEHQLSDGSGALARFNNLSDMVLGADGNLYVADSNTIRQVTPAGAVQTIAGGADNAAPRDGQGTAARFGQVLSFDVSDARGTLLVLASNPASGELALRKVAPDGTVSTALTLPHRPYGGSDALLRLSRLGQPVLGAGSRIDVLDSATALITPLAGKEDDTLADIDGPAAQARFAAPIGLASDGKGTIYVLERSGLKLLIRKIGVDGQVSTLAKQDLGSTNAIVADADTLYVSTGAGGVAASGAIYRVSADGAVQLIAGQPLHAPATRDGTGIEALFGDHLQLRGIDSQGNLYAAEAMATDSAAHWRKVTPAGVVSTVDRPPAEIFLAGDGQQYMISATGRVARVDGSVLGAGLTNNGFGANIPGPLPGRLSPSVLVPFGKDALLAIAGSAIYKITLPH